MTTTFTLTLYLAQAIGLYLILIGLSGLVAPERWTLVIHDLASSPGLTLLIGVVTFAIGVALVGVHCVLRDPLAIIVTVIGWIALIEGALLIAVPAPLIRLGRWSMRYTRLWAAISLILGILLGLAGHSGTAFTAQFV